MRILGACIVALMALGVAGCRAPSTFFIENRTAKRLEYTAESTVDRKVTKWVGMVEPFDRREVLRTTLGLNELKIYVENREFRFANPANMGSVVLKEGELPPNELPPYLARPNPGGTVSSFFYDGNAGEFKAQLLSKADVSVLTWLFGCGGLVAIMLAVLYQASRRVPRSRSARKRKHAI